MTGQTAAASDVVGPYVRLQRSSVQSIPNNTTTTIVWNSTLKDTAGGFDGTSTYTCKMAGVYSISAGAQFAFAGTGGRGVGVLKNGATYVAAERVPAITTNSNVTMVSTHGEIELVVGDTLTVVSYQDSSGNLNLNSDDSTFFSAVLIQR